MISNTNDDSPMRVDYKSSDFGESGRPGGGRPGSRRSFLKTPRVIAPRRTPSMGAVRLSKEPKQRFKHGKKVSFGLLAITGGILVTTQSLGTIDSTKTALPVLASIASPTFFFNDSDNALGDKMPLMAGKAILPSGQTGTSNLTGSGNLIGANNEASIATVGADITVAHVAMNEQPQLFDFSKGNHYSAQTADKRAGSHGTGTAAMATTTLVTENGSPLVNADDPWNVNDNGPKTTTVSPLVNHPSIAAIKKKATFPDGAQEESVTVKSGDTLSKLLNDRGVKIEQMPQLLTDDVVKKHLSNLRIGQTFDIVRLSNGDFHSLTAKVGNDRRITIRRADSGFAIASIDLPVEKERVVTSGTIEASLYVAAEQADLKQSTIMELSDIFQWELDFARDIRKGDQFSLVYDRLYREGKYIGDGDILAAEFVRGGKRHQAVRYTDPEGNTGYFSPNGQSKKRTFLRHPVDVVRITSKFDPNRMHPVLHRIRAHRGVDYGSPIGTPIRATADGTVKFAGSKGAYGKTVIIAHGTDIRTLYAHMSRISGKVKHGKRIKQGDVIGYVGKTGRVTGAHLHYEFQKNGKHVDPLKVKLPAAQPLRAELRGELRELSDDLFAQMASVLPAANEQVASAATTAVTPANTETAQ